MRHARSTVLVGSIAVVRASDRWDAYVKALPSAQKEVLLHAVAATWIPIDAALAHYMTCDTLGFTPEQECANGRGTYDHAGGSIFGTVTKMARGVGVTPWTLFAQLQRFWGRGYDGGGVSVTRLGPKEARIDVAEIPLAESRYYRNALRGLVIAASEMFCTKTYAREFPRTYATVSYRIQWA
jgi:hypothetical protein